MVFKNPKFKAGYQSNTYVVEGKPEVKSLAEILPSYLQQLVILNFFIFFRILVLLNL